MSAHMPDDELDDVIDALLPLVRLHGTALLYSALEEIEDRAANGEDLP